MKIIGYLGSPRLKGRCSKLMDKMLEGAASKGAEIKRVDLINHDIQFCKGCEKCYKTNPDLRIGKCIIKDEMASLLEEYVDADSYIFASPVYDMCMTALMKQFWERKIALTYKPKDAYGKLVGARFPIEFKKLAILLSVGNAAQEYADSMGKGCFDSMSGLLGIEQIWVMEEYYVGGTETISDDEFNMRLNESFDLGVRLVEETQQAREEE